MILFRNGELLFRVKGVQWFDPIRKIAEETEKILGRQIKLSLQDTTSYRENDIPFEMW